MNRPNQPQVSEEAEDDDGSQEDELEDDDDEEGESDGDFWPANLIAELKNI